ncbi:MAG: hypothetical protein ACOX8V_02630 [Thermoleophilia bacterium]|jgi:hypothetical protein
MAQRTRQSAALLILPILVLLTLWGCGADTEESSTTTIPSTVAHSSSTTVTTPSLIGGPATLVGTRLPVTQETPAAYVYAVEQARPIVLLFYLPGGVDDQKVLTGVSSLQAQFPGYVFLLFDSTNPDAYGDLSTLLKIDYSPALILIDSTGTINTVWSGYVDEGTIKQCLVNLGEV